MIATRPQSQLSRDERASIRIKIDQTLRLAPTRFHERRAAMQRSFKDLFKSEQALVRVANQNPATDGPEPGTAILVANKVMSVVLNEEDNATLFDLVLFPQKPVRAVRYHCDFNTADVHTPFVVRNDDTIDCFQYMRIERWTSENTETEFLISKEIGKRTFDIMSEVLSRRAQTEFLNLCELPTFEPSPNVIEQARREAGVLFAILWNQPGVASALKSLATRKHYQNRLNMVRNVLRGIGWRPKLF